MQKLIFASMPAYGGSEKEIILLVRSLRTFGGNLADAPFWVLLSRQMELKPETWAELRKLGVRKYTFNIDESALQFPFGGKTFAAARAESLAQNKADLLAWLDPDTLILHEPLEFLLPAGKQMGSRPVMLKNIGSPYDQPLDRFWDIIYRHCGTCPENIFPMTTAMDSMRIRPQFSAGVMVVRPEQGLLRDWRRNFQDLYQHRLLSDMYLKHTLYRIFIHQAVLAGTVLAKLGRAEIQDFSNRVNYPIFQHAGFPADRRPRKLNDLVSCRYDEFESFFGNPNWRTRIHIDEPLKSWLEAALDGC